MTSSSRGWGDFNGDGRTDLLVDVVYGQPDDATFIVLGSVGPGTLDPFAVGIRVPHPHIKPGGFEAFPASVGDQNGDGADDVSFSPKLYSGRQLTTLPPGAALPAPFRTLPSQYVGLLQIDAGKPPSFVLLDRVREPPCARRPLGPAVAQRGPRTCCCGRQGARAGRGWLGEQPPHRAVRLRVTSRLIPRGDGTSTRRAEHDQRVRRDDYSVGLRVRR